MSIDLEFLYRKYGPMVLRRCRYMLHNEDKALDALQDTFVRLLRYRERVHDRALSSLLYRIATNVCLNVLRAERRQPKTESEELLLNIAASSDPESEVVNRHFLYRIFRREMPSTRTIAVMHYIDGMTLREVADEVGLSVSGVRKRLRLLRERAKKLEEVPHEA